METFGIKSITDRDYMTTLIRVLKRGIMTHDLVASHGDTAVKTAFRLGAQVHGFNTVKGWHRAVLKLVPVKVAYNYSFDVFQLFQEMKEAGTIEDYFIYAQLPGGPKTSSNKIEIYILSKP